MDILLTIYFFIIGSALGSFSLVLAWRMHAKKDWVRGRSKCDSCHKQLKWQDMVPIFSWIYLKGKCRYCGNPMSKQLIGAELLLGILFGLSWYFWPLTIDVAYGYLTLLSWLVCLVILSALFWYDIRWLELPTKLIKYLFVAAVVFSAFRYLITGQSLQNSVVMPILGAMLLFGIFISLYVFSKGKWIGFGDVRLAIPIGLIAGSPILSWLLLFVASVIGIFFALPSLATKKKKLSSKIPFGPMLILATVIVLLFGQILVDKYLAFPAF